MFLGSKIFAGLAGAAIATGLAAMPAQAAPTDVNSFATWSANVTGVSETGTLASGTPTPFAVGGKSYQVGDSPFTTAVTTGAPAAFFTPGLTASWLGQSGYADVPGVGNTIVISLNTGFFPTAFGMYVEGDSNGATNAFSISEYSAVGGTGTLLGTMTFALSGPDSFLGYYGGTAGTVKSLVVTDNAGATDQAFGDFFAATSAAAAVPEPASVALLGVSLLGLGLARRRKKV